MIVRHVSPLLAFLFVLSAAVAADEPPAYESPEAAQADPDFALQGEYVGENQGVQVVALGGGEFQVVLYPGGLPGAGGRTKEKQTTEMARDEVRELVAKLKRTERKSSTLGAKPPPGATVLFDGSQELLEKHWQPGARKSGDGLLAAGCTSRDAFGDFTLHLEFRLPYMPAARGQGRGNSGVYYQGRYETQVLDSFGLEGRENECGGIYGVRTPDVNMCLPPLVWQTYDAEFTAARWDAQGKKLSDARLTVRLNGVVIHQDAKVPRPTTAAPRGESPEPGPLYLQDHGNPVYYRNIWVLPRDAEREGRRPIVPSFERLYAADPGGAAQGGRLLAGELGCTACHPADGPLAAHLLPRQAPRLDWVGSRVRPEHLLKFIADPHGTKPGTLMPDMFAGVAAAERESAARAIVNYLSTTGRLREQSSSRRFAQNGERLFHQLGCVACHAPRNGAQVSAAASVPLGELAEKYSVASLAEFLKDPHQARPAGRMPSLNLNNDEARDLACYLVGDVAARPAHPNMRFAVYEGSWDRLPEFDKLKPAATGESAGLDLYVAGRSGNFGMRFEGFLKIEREGRYTLHLGSDDGSVLWIDGQKVVDVDGLHPHATNSGQADLKPGMHPLRVDYMQGGGEWTLELEYEGPGLGRQSIEPAIFLTATPPPALPADDEAGRFVFDASQVERGRELFAAVGCAACHTWKRGDEVVRSKLAAKPLRQCDPSRGCLAAAPARGAPDFALNRVEREALATLLASPVPAANPTPAERVEHTLAAFNCYACHSRSGVGGPEADRSLLFVTTIPEMGDEGRIPPPLDGVGDKLQEGWLRHVLNDGVKDRPYMLTRMPRFGTAEVSQLADAFVALDGRTEAAAPQASEPPSRLKSTGRYLVGDKALACIKCHTFGEHRATGIQAIDLQTMTRRIREDWFFRYLPDPPRYRPGTRMPTGFAGGRSTIAGVYDGDPPRQMAAIWAYLSDGDKAGIPDGLIADVIELKPDTRPVIYRNFIDGLSPRGIAVGYPEQVDLAWDAGALCLSLAWHGRFIDASKHWSGRGAGFQTPLGDHVVRVEQALPLAVLESPSSPWPTEPPKQRGYRFRGYRLDAAGRPTFQYDGPSFSIDDFPQPVAGKPEGHFQRHLTLHAEQAVERLYFRAAAGGEIKPADGGWYQTDSGLKIRVQSGGAAPIVRPAAGRQELLVPVLFQGGKAEIVEQIVW